MPGIDRRKFISNMVASGTGLMAGVHLLSCSPDEERNNGSSPGSSYNIMREVMKYPKIDSHAHVYFSADSPETQLDFADRLGIDKLVISRPMAPGSEGTPEEFIRCNSLVLAAVEKYPDRFIGQPTLNPRYLRESLDEIERCMDRGTVGLKVYNHVKISDPLFYPIIEKFIDLKMIILMHAGIGKSRITYDATEPPNVSIPEDFVEVAKRYPEAMFQFAHLAGGVDWEDACKALRDSPNVFVDMSGSNNDGSLMDCAMKYIGEDRLLFGCDNSFYQGVGQMLAANLTDSQRGKIFFHNYNNILRKAGRNVD